MNRDYKKPYGIAPNLRIAECLNMFGVTEKMGKWREMLCAMNFELGEVDIRQSLC